MKQEEKRLYEKLEQLTSEHTAVEEAMQRAIGYVEEGGSKIKNALAKQDMMEVEAGYKLVEFGKDKQGVQWPEHSNPDSLANEFADYFENKILKIRKVLEDTEPYHSEQKAIPKLSRLVPMMEKEVLRVITSLKTKLCEMDSIPTHILKKVTPAVLPLKVKIVNLSLTQGEFCRCWKTAVGRPLLKKLGLALIHSNY